MTLKSKVILNISYKKVFDFLMSLTFLFNNKPFESKYGQNLITSNNVSGKPQYQYLYLFLFDINHTCNQIGILILFLF